MYAAAAPLLAHGSERSCRADGLEVDGMPDTTELPNQAPAALHTKQAQSPMEKILARAGSPAQ